YPTTGTIHWNWDLANGAVNYRIYSSTGGNGQSPLLSAAATSYTTTGLAANTTAAFFVRAISCGQNADSAVFELATKPVAPAPLAPAFLTVDSGLLEIRWTKLAAAPQELSSEGYALEVSTDSNFNGTLFSSVTYSVSQSTLSLSLFPNTTYYARVAALNWAGEMSSYTVLGATSTLSSPLAQTQFFAVYGTSMTINWAPLPSAPPAASSRTAEGYRVDLSTASDFTGVLFSSFTPAVTLGTLTVSGLNSETPYYARAGGANWNGALKFASVGFAVTKDTSPPSAITDLAAGVGASASTLNLTWTAPGNNGAGGCVSGGRYRIDYASYTAYSFSPGTYKVDVSTSFCPGEAQSRGVSGLLPNTTYFTRVYALDQDMVGGPLSNGATQSTLAPLVIALNPTYLGVFQSSATVAWAALPASPPDASSKTSEGYVLEASSTNFGVNQFGGVVYSSLTTKVAASTLSITGLTTDVTYYFRVGTLNWDSQPNYLTLGSTLTVTTPGEAPADAQIFRVYAGSITVSWLAVNSDNGYLVQASTASDFTGTLFSSKTPNGVNSFLTPSGLDTNTTYFLRVGSLWGTTTSYAAVSLST
ncbi:MAG: hypothetical protein COV48_10405, partial [Elusimicrobia bacterium CG11_big_fil_rev_8_21_14_0_20_64_6]